MYSQTTLGMFIQALITSILYYSGFMSADTQIEFALQQGIAALVFLLLYLYQKPK